MCMNVYVPCIFGLGTESVIALNRFFQKKKRPVLPSTSVCGPSTLTRRELEAANGSVKRILVEATNVVGNDMTPRRGQYNEYTAERSF